jgi:hypothetical protein
MLVPMDSTGKHSAPAHAARRYRVATTLFSVICVVIGTLLVICGLVVAAFYVLLVVGGLNVVGSNK